MRDYQLWIDGSWAKPASGQSIDRISPAHGALLASYSAGTSQDVDAAVAAARRAFEGGTWRDLPGGEKSLVLNRWADLMQSKAGFLAEIEAEEAGKPIRAARGEIDAAIELVRYAAALAWQVPGKAMTHSGPEKLGLVTHEPCGVVGMILPWNFPAMTLFQKLPFALAAGCASVIKPSEFTSGTALQTALLAEQAGVPPGMINIVTGTGPDVGEALASHADIDMISFTGSSRVGKLIAHHAADRVKKVALELGGKGANIVFADADFDAAIEGALAGFVINQGEECCAGSRLLVEETIAEEFLARLVERARQVRVGLPADEATEMSALIHESHLERVLGYVEKGRREGAKLLTGGERLTQDGLDKGSFIAPTIFSGVTPDMTIFREEIFGPVVSVVTFRTVDEAIAIANDTIYGLANGVWSNDINKAMLVSRGIRSGTVYVNTYLETLPQLPFGGIRESGLGRENGTEGLLEFMHVKATFIKLRKPLPAVAA